MKKQALCTFILLVSLLVGVFGTAAAQTGDEPTPTSTGEATLVPTEEVTPVPTEEATPVPDEDQPGYRFWTHPVVSLLSAYFDREIAEESDDEETTPEQEGTEVPDEEGALPEEEDGIGEIGKQIAAYHEAGMGFGVLVKIYSMAEEARLACDAENTAAPAEGAEAVEPCVPLSADELVASFKSGNGMGQLMKEYGKPAMLGVGHVKKALKNMDTTTTTTTEAGKGKDKAPKADKVKGPKNKK